MSADGVLGRPFRGGDRLKPVPRSASRNGVGAASNPPTMRKRRADGYFERVYEIVARIPRGKVVTYGQIAALLGHPRGARVVGWAMHDAPRARKLPCHRVVNAAGTMAPGDIFGGAEVQRGRLEAEGVVFTRGGRIDLGRSLWSIRVQGPVTAKAEGKRKRAEPERPGQGRG